MSFLRKGGGGGGGGGNEKCEKQKSESSNQPQRDNEKGWKELQNIQDLRSQCGSIASN